MSSHLPAVDRRVQQSLTVLRSILVVGLWLATLYWAWARPVSRPVFGIVFITGAITIFLLNEVNESLEADRSYKVLYSLLMLTLLGFVVAMGVYELQNFEELAFNRFTKVYFHEKILVGMTVLTVIFITAREFGIAFTGFIVFVILYGFFGDFAPGVLYHQGIEYDIFTLFAALNVSGVYGTLVQIVAAWVTLFLLYAGFVEEFGGIRFILEVLDGIVDYLQSGVAQLAVILSMIVGSVSGAAAANVAITGSITIPLMKQDGLSGHQAGAIESVASTGGQVLPPIMGVAAFLMADFVGVPYGDIVIAATIPALVFYVTVSYAIKLIASEEIEAKHDVSLTDEELLEKQEEAAGLDQPDISLDTKRDLAFETTRFVLPFLVLIYALIVANYSVTYAGLLTATSMFAFGAGMPVLRDPNLDTVTRVVKRTHNGFLRAAETAVPLTIVVAAVGVVLEVFFVTGVPSNITIALIDLSGGIFVVAMLLALLVCIMLGFGMPTVAAYILVAILIAPSLEQTFGLPMLSVHFFVFYGAIISNITPPVAFAVVVASQIAEANFWRTGLEAMKVGLALVVLPFTFVIHPEILNASSFLMRGYIGLIVLGGLLIVTFAIHGRGKQFDRSKELALRGLIGLAGLAVVFNPYTTVSAVALVLLGLMMVTRVDRRVRSYIGSSP